MQTTISPVQNQQTATVFTPDDIEDKGFFTGIGNWMGPSLSGGKKVTNEFAPFFVDVPWKREYGPFDRESKIHDLTIAEGDMFKADLRFARKLLPYNPLVALAPLAWHTITGATSEVSP